MNIFRKKVNQNNDKHIVTDKLLADMLPEQLSMFTHFSLGQRFEQDHSTNQSSVSILKKSWFRKIIGLPAYHWVLISQLIVIIPHFAHMPSWLVIYGLCSTLMQLPRVKRKFAKHQRLKNWYRNIQLLGFLSAVIGLWMHFGAFTIEAGVAFLLLCMASKIWELYHRRDALVLLNLSLFVCASLFLLDQGFTSSMQAFIAVLSVLMAFVALNDDVSSSQFTEDISHGAGRLRSLGILAGLSIPLLIILFLFFPRLPPLWSIHLSNSQATTGMSDSMSPGDFSQLSQSTELAFRVEFENIKPSVAEMYWRGLVFSEFDGKTWRPNPRLHNFWSNNQTKPIWLTKAEKSTEQTPYPYAITLEPTNQRWLFALGYPTQIETGMVLSSEFTLKSVPDPVIQKKRYQLNYQPTLKINQILSEQEKVRYLKLPKTGNEKAKQLAKQLYTQSGSQPQAYLNTIKQWIHRGNFRYTLSPPKLDVNRIDEFLLETQAGFCEHYSSSFTFLMRAAGIPARVVVGYQGGQLGRDGNSWEVRQMDAHAWSEVWIEGYGWKRVDPTSWVAPERIEKGMDALSRTQGASLFGEGMMAQLSYQQFRMLQEIRRLSDQMSYFWDREIVGFDNDKQSQSLLKWFKISDWSQQLIIMFALFSVIIALIIVWLWWQRRQVWHPADRELMKLSQHLAKNNKHLAKSDSEGMLAWLDRLASSQLMAKQQKRIAEIKYDYRKLRYSQITEIPINKASRMSSDYLLKISELNKQVKILYRKQ